MNLEKLEEVIEILRKYGLAEIEIENGKEKISVKAASNQMNSGMMSAPQMYAAPMPTAAPVMATPNLANPAIPIAPAAVSEDKLIKSPFVGTYYSAPSPGSDDFIHIGKRVKKGETLCIVEAMKLMNEIEAEKDGVIKEILVDSETPVQFDQPLFILE